MLLFEATATLLTLGLFTPTLTAAFLLAHPQQIISPPSRAIQVVPLSIPPCSTPEGEITSATCVSLEQTPIASLPSAMMYFYLKGICCGRVFQESLGG